MAKVGRPSKMTPETIQKAKELAASGHSNAKVAEILNISNTTLANWQKFNPEFLWALREGQQIANERVEASLYQRATGYTHPEEKLFCYEGQITRTDTLKHYPPDIDAAKFWLKNRDPKHWREISAVEADVKANLSASDEVKELLDWLRQLSTIE